MAGIKGRSGHIGRIGIDPQSPIFRYEGPYRGERVEGKGKDLYFQTQDEMLNALEDKTQQYTPMVWDNERQMYVIDFSSADLLGQ